MSIGHDARHTRQIVPCVSTPTSDTDVGFGFHVPLRDTFVVKGAPLPGYSVRHFVPDAATAYSHQEARSEQESACPTHRDAFVFEVEQ